MFKHNQRLFPSPLRYPGGKRKIANFLKLLFLHNNVVGHEYVEPYAGGASVALALLFEEYSSRIHINDLNRSIFAFWDSVLNRTDSLCRRISDTPVTLEQWELQKLVQVAKEPDPLDLGFSTFLLNRTNRSGIIDGGIIGGKNQDGKWKIDARYNKPGLIQRIEKVARYRNRITLTRLDAASFIQNTLPKLPKASFVYLDPPYYLKGKGLYENFYEHSDHVEISQLVREICQPWIVSYDETPEILELYSEFERIAYSLSYSASYSHRGSELMFLGPGVDVPAVDSPANIFATEVDRARIEAYLTN